MLLGGRYQLLELAGRGGMAEVWRAEALGAAGFRRTVAVKRVLTHLLNTEMLREMFIEEARVCSMLDHPNIVQVSDFGQDGENFFLVMEWVEGMTLRELLDSGCAPSPALAAGIGIEVLRALDAAHSHAVRRADGASVPTPIVHRDVSPSNVMLSVRGVVKLGDFGFARAFDRSRMTPANVVKGKLYYLAPEMARGQPASAQSDLYACGVMLWEMMAGRRYYAGMADREIASSLVNRRPPVPLRSVAPAVPAALADVVDRALLTNPAERYEDAAQFARALADQLRAIPERTDAVAVAAEVNAALARNAHAPVHADEASGPHLELAETSASAPAATLTATSEGSESIPIPLLPTRRER